jgi:hypothetical protein
MKKLVLLLMASVLITACSPCRYVANHPECFQPDTVRITDIQVHVEKQTIKVDSIVYDTLPGESNIIEKTVYLTKMVHKTDTIIKSKEVAKVNPINEQLNTDNQTLKDKNYRLTGQRNRLLIGLIGLIALLIITFVLKKYIK